MLRNRGFTHVAAIAAIVAALVVAIPRPALARVDNLWGVWASEVTNRSKIELPFVILASLPAMIISTPFWFGVWSLDRLKHPGHDAAEDEEADE